MHRYADKRVRSKESLISLFSSPRSLKDEFFDIFYLVCYFMMSTPPLPPPLPITYNKTKLMLCILVSVGACDRLGNIFALMVDRINLIINLIRTILNNGI